MTNLTGSDDVLLPDPAVRPTMKVWPDAGRIFGLSKSATYDAVARGDIPSIRIGGRLVVPTAAVRKLLGLDAP